MKTIKLKYNPKLKERFRNREIQEKWKKKYKVFDDDDLRLALSQPKYHFSEWFVARIFARKSYGVLLEKYTCKNHLKKTKILKNLFSPEDINFIGKLNFPDLLVYKGKEFFFVEVKMDNDKIFKKQEESLKKLRKRFHCDILIYELKERKLESGQGVGN
jgi:hypothetical protein